MSVLVDTSVWIAFLRKGPAAAWSPRLARALTDDEVVTVAPVVAELLYGARGDHERAVIDDLAQAVRLAGTDLDAWIAAGDLGRRWRAAGRTLSIVDALVAAVASRDGLPLWTLDGDFDPLFEAGELTRFDPSRAGA